MIFGNVVAWVGFNYIRSQLHTLPHERDDLVQVTVYHIATRLGIGTHHKRLYHQWHGIAFTFSLESCDVIYTLVMDLGLIGNEKEIGYNAGRISTQGLLYGILNQLAV